MLCNRNSLNIGACVGSDEAVKRARSSPMGALILCRVLGELGVEKRCEGSVWGLLLPLWWIQRTFHGEGLISISGRRKSEGRSDAPVKWKSSFDADRLFLSFISGVLNSFSTFSCQKRTGNKENPHTIGKRENKKIEPARIRTWNLSLPTSTWMINRRRTR